LAGEDVERCWCGCRWVFCGGRAYYEELGKRYSFGAVRVDRSKDPTLIDLANDRGGYSWRGLYRRSKDFLVWAVPVEDADRPSRPSSLISEPGAEVKIWTLRRVKK
jgi:hypothetical protein